MPETASEFLNKNGYTNDYILTRFRDLLRYLQKFLNAKGIAQSVKIDMNSLKKAVIDYFVDTVRIKEFHNITNTKTEKIYSYTAYWLLRRKPIQVVDKFLESPFINESFVASYLLNGMFTEKNLAYEKSANMASLDEFLVLLIYYLKYRQVSQQSLELMIKAFYSGCDFSTR